MIDLLTYFLLSFVTFFIYFLPGFLVIGFFKKFSEPERLTLSFLLSTLIFFVIGLSVHMFGIIWNFFTILVPTVTLIFILLISKRKLKIGKGGKFLLIIFLVQFFIKLLILPNIEFFPMGGDWKTNYELSKTFLNKDWQLSGDRTFLYNFVLGFFMSAFQQGYWYVQIASTLISSLFLLPLYLIGLNFFNKKIAILTFFLLLVAPFMHWTLYTWSKSFASFFIFIVYYFVMKRKLNFFVGIAGAFAFLTHPFSLLYLIPAGLFVLCKKKEFKLNWKTTLLVSIPIAIALVSWYIYTSTITPIPTIFKYYPIAVKGYEVLYKKSSQEIWKDFIETPIHKIFFVRVVNAVIPTIPLLFLIVKTISLFSPTVLLLHKAVDFSQVPWTYHHLLTFPGHISLLLFIFASIGFLKLFKERSRIKDILYLMAGPFLLILFLYGWIVPIGSAVGLPLSPLLALIGFWMVEKTKEKNKWILLIFTLAMLESIIFSYWFGLHIEFTRQVLIQSGGIEEYNKIITVYKFLR